MNKKGGGATGAPAPSTAPQKSPTARTRAIPPVFQSIQANFCKTPGCINFNAPPHQGPIQSGRGGSSDGYAIVNTGSTMLACRHCKVATTLKSNQAIYEELQRQGDLIWRNATLRCPNAASKRRSGRSTASSTASGDDCRSASARSTPAAAPIGAGISTRRTIRKW